MAWHSFEVGKAYFIRAIPMYYVGRLVSITETDLVLEDAAWIPNTGRFFQALRDGTFAEVEPFVDPVVVLRDKVGDFTLWRHPLPLEQK